MAIVSRAEFAEICRTTVAIVNTNISRNKISYCPDDKRLIDTENPLNKIFKKNSIAKANQKIEEERQVKREKRNPEPVQKTFEQVIKQTADELGIKDPVLDKIYTPTPTAAQQKARDEKNKQDEEELTWDQRKKIADALQAERKAELSQLQVEKLQGQLMPVDLVESILKINIQDIFRTFESSCINLASIYCDILGGGDREKLAEITGKLRLELSRVIERVKQSSAQEVENAIEDYADARSRGERK